MALAYNKAEAGEEVRLIAASAGAPQFAHSAEAQPASNG